MNPIVRIAAALAVASAGVYVAADSLGSALAEANPTLALQLAPRNVVALQTMAGNLLGDVNDPAARRSAAALADQALSRDAGAASAAITLAIIQGVEGGNAKSAALMAAAERLTRRDLRANIWQVENSVARGDVAGALRHFDFALRTSESAPDLMYPTLNAAIGDRRLAGPIARLLATRPPWAIPFLGQLGSAAPDLAGAAEFYLMVKRLGLDPPAIGWTAVVDRLTTAGDVARARNVHTVLRASDPAALINDPNFRGVADSPSVFDWLPSVDEGLQVQIGGGVPQLSFNAPAGFNGNIARQMLVLAPGRYRLRNTAMLSDDNGSTPAWKISCVGGDSFESIPVATAVTAPVAFSVPAGCRAQWIVLALTLVNDERPTAAQISNVQIERIP